MRRYTDATPTIAPLAISPDARSPCPFCGAPAGLRHAVPARMPGGFAKASGAVQVQCTNCGACGPIYGDKKSAFLGWKHGEPTKCD